ncbi:MAG TPA: magnesium/cobalt transporter CorA [candidate division Zixibacteria bacterium]|nr:magnesium/cobalt transporter CorA [candidate division Zixibacteria bacterium]
MIVNCAAYEGGRKLADIPVAEVPDYLARPETFVWIALKDPENGELETLQAVFGLPELAVEDAKHGHQRPKIEEYGDSLFVVLHMIERAGAELLVGEIDIFAGRNYVLSVRRQAARGFADVRARCEKEPELLRHGPGYVLYALMDAVVDGYFPILDALESELETIEDGIFSNQSSRATIEQIYELKRKLNVVRHATEPLLEATSRLFGGRVPQICAGLQDYFRDIYDHLTRLNQSNDGLRDMATTAMSVNLSLITMQENEVTKRFAAYGALVAVPTMIAGVYGMNFQHMPELGWVYGYPLSLLAMAVIDLYLFYRFKQAKWL